MNFLFETHQRQEPKTEVQGPCRARFEAEVRNAETQRRSLAIGNRAGELQAVFAHRKTKDATEARSEKSNGINDMTPKQLEIPTYPYREQEMQRACDEWGMNCGPGAFATMLGVTPDDIKPIFDKVGFPEKKYTNAVMMMNALISARVPFSNEKDFTTFGTYSLCRIQFHGPWMNEGVPFRARLRYTHWVGAFLFKDKYYVFDVNAGWQQSIEWMAITVPKLTALYKRADGKWSITHRLELFV